MIDEKIEIMQPYVCKTMRIQTDSTEQIMQQEQFEEFLQQFDPQSFFSFCVSGWSEIKKLRPCSFQNPRARCGTHTHLNAHTDTYSSACTKALWSGHV